MNIFNETKSDFKADVRRLKRWRRFRLFLIVALVIFVGSAAVVSRANPIGVGIVIVGTVARGVQAATRSAAAVSRFFGDRARMARDQGSTQASRENVRREAQELAQDIRKTIRYHDEEVKLLQQLNRGGKNAKEIAHAKNKIEMNARGLEKTLDSLSRMK